MDLNASESSLSFKRCPTIELRSSSKLITSSLVKMLSNNRPIWLEVDILERLKPTLRTGEELWERTPKPVNRCSSTLNLFKTQGLCMRWCNNKMWWKWQMKKKKWRQWALWAVVEEEMKLLNKIQRKVGFSQASVLVQNLKAKHRKSLRNQMLTPHNFSKPRKCLRTPTRKNE